MYQRCYAQIPETWNASGERSYRGRGLRREIGQGVGENMGCDLQAWQSGSLCTTASHVNNNVGSEICRHLGATLRSRTEMIESCIRNKISACDMR